ncbi:transaldolase family protein [Lachnotalea sp. AF33-28]|uniref:transaldolase family protein n=1 Tax=Lachnotalea sp. AF33-28 TaxID=2292046 RepID=UPI000E4AA895|nr:transaldolase family protein [Lachnotalea sp. AF33-28]RHP35685.1 fructose-6-phosphate aldolase [Lachnotalea sp. AF33-28]
MEILLDTANMAAIRRAVEYYPVDGFTTNPSILSGVRDEVRTVLAQFKELIQPSQTIHMQTTAEKAEDMVSQAEKLTDYFGPNFHVKIPMNPEGIKAAKMAKAKGLKVTVTAIFTAAQALIAAKAGADYVAPYVNRIDNISGDGVSVVCDIIRILDNYGFATKVLGASFKNVQQIQALAVAGCQAATMTPDLIDTFVNHPYTVKSLEDFKKDWERRFKDSHITDYL